MDTSAENYESEGKRPGLFLAVSQTVESFDRWLAGLVILSDGDQKKAGILYGSEEREEKAG
jgi:hypothetical protein